MVPAEYQEPLIAPPRAAPAATAPAGIAPPDRLNAGLQTPPPAPAPENDPTAPRLAPPQELAIPLPPEEPPSNGKSTDTSTRRSTFKPVVESAPANNDVQHGSPDPAGQTAKLVSALYDEHDASVASGADKGDSPIFASPLRGGHYGVVGAKTGTVPGSPLRLADCLRSAAADRRMEAVDAYWTARQADVYGRLLAGQSGQLDALRPALAAQNPPSPTGMLVLRGAKLAVDARMTDAEADRVAASFQLAMAAGLPVENDPPRPTVAPFAGHFALLLGEKNRTLPSSWPLRQAESELPRWEQAIGSQCAAVREAAAAQAAATADVLAGRAEVARAIAAIDLHTNETATFLQELSDYNRAIARYVSLRLGPDAAAETVAAALENR